MFDFSTFVKGEDRLQPAVKMRLSVPSCFFHYQE